MLAGSPSLLMLAKACCAIAVQSLRSLLDDVPGQQQNASNAVGISPTSAKAAQGQAPPENLHTSALHAILQ